MKTKHQQNSSQESFNKGKGVYIKLHRIHQLFNIHKESILFNYASVLILSDCSV